MSDKIQSHHLERKAVFYVRQSSPHQVAHNRESRALQYAMKDRLRALGWSEVEIVDEDLGRSAAGMVARTGFERMVADVCLGKVGAVTETLFGSLKVERLHDMRFETRRQAKDEVVDWLIFYSRNRMHSTLGYTSSVAFEKNWRCRQETLAA